MPPSLAGALSVLPPSPVVWDEAYKVGRMEASTPLRYILSQTPLRWAWYLGAVVGGAVHLGVCPSPAARHPHRGCHRATPRANSMHTVGRLYWHKGDHADLARKMIAHFKEDVRQRTYLGTFAYDEATISAPRHQDRHAAPTRHRARLRAIAQREKHHPSPRANC